MKERIYQPETKAVLEDLEKKYLDYFEYKNNSDELIWHYTDQNGLIGVMKSGKVRASNAFYLNDFQEVTHGKNLILNWYDIKKAGISKTDPLAALYQEFVESIEVSIRISDLVDQPYVSCFSSREGEDLLSQWQAYGKGGFGYSLGFNPKEIAENCQDAKLFRVIYDETKQKEIVEQVLEEYYHELYKILNSTNGLTQHESFVDFKHSVAKFIHVCVCCFKHWSWTAEHEYRLLSLIAPFESSKNSKIFNDIQFSGTDLGAIKPFIDLNITKEIEAFDEKTKGNKKVLPLKKIIVGSKVDFPLAKNSLKILLERHNYGSNDYYGKSVEILPSKLTLR